MFVSNSFIVTLNSCLYKRKLQWIEQQQRRCSACVHETFDLQTSKVTTAETFPLEKIPVLKVFGFDTSVNLADTCSERVSSKAISNWCILEWVILLAASGNWKSITAIPLIPSLHQNKSQTNADALKFTRVNWPSVSLLTRSNALV